MSPSHSVTAGDARPADQGDAPQPAFRGDLSEVLLFDQAVTDLLETVVAAAAGAVPSLSGASLSLLKEGERRYETTTATSAVVKSLDESQYASELGPCVQAIHTGAEVRVQIPVPDWPDFSSAAELALIRSVWSLPVAVADRVAGALNLYSHVDAPWSGSGAEPARLLARQATAVLNHGMTLARSEHANVTLRRALETRTVIGQAQGVLIARQSITPDEAFDILRRASQRTNRKLREVAAEIVAGVSQGKPHP